MYIYILEHKQGELNKPLRLYKELTHRHTHTHYVAICSHTRADKRTNHIFVYQCSTLLTSQIKHCAAILLHRVSTATTQCGSLVILR